MSGIFGILDYKKKGFDSSQNRTVLRAWNREYGLDGNGETPLEYGTIGCFLDKINDRVPLGDAVFEKDGKTAVFDALIFNREELLPELGEKDNSISDEKLIGEYYLRFGAKGLSKINGDFAGAVYDQKTGKLELFSNHLGTRPLYYYHKDGQIAFSTDSRGLCALTGADLSLDEELLYRHLKLMNTLESERTCFKYVFETKPSHIISFEKDGTISKKAYWKLRENPVIYENDEAYIQKLRELVDDALERRLAVSEKVVGGELSGGMDSTVLDVLISRKGRKGVYYSWSPALSEYPMQSAPEKHQYDEREIIEEVCLRENIACMYDKKSSDSAEAAFKTENSQILPIGSNTFVIGNAMKFFSDNGARIAFSGWGGDEGVSHRANVVELLYASEYKAYWHEVTHAAKGNPLRIGKKLAVDMMTLRNRLKPWETKTTHCQSFSRICNVSYEKNIKPFVTGKALRFSYHPITQIEDGGNRARMENAAWQGAKNHIRYLFPYLDYRVEDFAVSIPRKMFYRNGTNRWIYRRAFGQYMPEKLLQSHSVKVDLGHCSYHKEIISGAGYIQELQQKLKMLDRKRWSAYLNFELLSNLCAADGFHKMDLDELKHFNRTISLCLEIQKLSGISGKTPEMLNCNLEEK